MVEVAFASGVASCAWFTPRASSPEPALYNTVEELISIGSGTGGTSYNLELTRPSSQTISLLSLQSQNKISGGTKTSQPDIKKIERKKGSSKSRQRSRKVKSADLDASGPVLESLLDQSQCFLFSSQPRVVNTLIPFSPTKHKVDDGSGSITVQQHSDYLSEVTISICMQQRIAKILHPSSLHEDYDFALEEKILGL